MRSTGSNAPMRVLLVAAGALAALLPASAARAESCADYLTFVTPVASFDGTSGSANAEDPVPTNARPFAYLDHWCGGAPLDPELTLRRIEDDAMIDGAVATDDHAEWTFYELAPAAPLDALTEYELCFRDGDQGTGCVTFRTSGEAMSTQLEPPTLTVVESTPRGSASADTVVEVTWTPFPGAVWVEARRGTQPPRLLTYDASATSSVVETVSAETSDEEQLCLVAVARAADGQRLESAPECVAIGSGCAVGASGRGAAEAAWLVASLGLVAWARRRRADDPRVARAQGDGTRRAESAS